MRWDKIAARILLILSVVHVAVAAPAIVRERYLDIVKDVTPVFENRGDPVDEPSGRFPPSGPHMGNDLSPALGTAPLQDDGQSMSGIQPQDNPLPESGTLHLHNELPATPGPPTAPDDIPPGSGTTESPPPSGAPPLQDDRPAASGLPLSDSDQSSTSGTLNKLPSTSSSQSSASGDRELPNSPPAGSEDPELHDDFVPLHPNWQDHPMWQQLYDFHANQRVPSSLDVNSEVPMHSEVPVPLEAPPAALEAHTFFNDALKQKLKTYAGYGLVAGVSAALTLEVGKLIKGNSHGAYVSAFFPPFPTEI